MAPVARPPATARRRRARRLVAPVVAVAALALGCGTSEPEPTTVALEAAEPGPAQLVGDWSPAPTTTAATITTLPVEAADPETGLTISEPIGPPWPTSFTVADAAGASVDLYASPGVRVPTGRSLSHPTHEGMPLVMLVRDTRTHDGGEWLQVQIPSRPNGATAWIRADDVTLRTVPHHIIVELGTRTVSVLAGDEALWSAPGAPGKASSPTPTGAFYVDAWAEPPDPTGSYGRYQVSFSGFSEVHMSFAGGSGQAAIHGTNRPELIGTPASNGCVRLSNDDVTDLVGLVETGSPVTILP
jgi:hypothetical protein